MWRHLVRSGVEPEEAEAQVVSVAWEVVAAKRGRRRLHPPKALVDAIWNEIRREAGLRRTQRLEVAPIPERFDTPAPEVDHLEHWPGLLGAAVAASVLTPRQVVIVAGTRMEQRSLADMAKSLGTTYDAVRMERCRAEKALRTFALSYDWSGS